jgi:hypothetical protein
MAVLMTLLPQFSLLAHPRYLLSQSSCARCNVHNTDCSPTIVHRFPQSIQANYGIVPKIRSRKFISVKIKLSLCLTD